MNWVNSIQKHCPPVKHTFVKGFFEFGVSEMCGGGG